MLTVLVHHLTHWVSMLLPRDEEGQAMTEYGLILALVAIALIGALTALALGLTGVFNRVVGALGG
jgi:pilus assembly protein Flp/PilA